MILLKAQLALFLLFVIQGTISYGQEIDESDESNVGIDAEEKVDDTTDSESEEKEPEESTDDTDDDKKDDGKMTMKELCDLPELDKLVDLLMAQVNNRIPITYEIPDRQLRTMTISDISVSNLNTLVRYRASVIACPGDGRVILTVPMRAHRPIVGLYRWHLHFPRGIGGRVSVGIADFDADAVIQFDQESGATAKLKDLKVMRLDGISIQSMGPFGGILGRISDQLFTLLVSNFRDTFRNFVQKELSGIIAKEMIEIPFATPGKSDGEDGNAI